MRDPFSTFHRKPKVSRSKYRDGARFRSMNELVRWVEAGKCVRHVGHTVNSTFIRNQQLHTLLRWLPGLRKAVAIKRAS